MPAIWNKGAFSGLHGFMGMPGHLDCHRHRVSSGMDSAQRAAEENMGKSRDMERSNTRSSPGMGCSFNYPCTLSVSGLPAQRKKIVLFPHPGSSPLQPKDAAGLHRAGLEVAGQMKSICWDGFLPWRTSKGTLMCPFHLGSFFHQKPKRY